MAIARLPPPRPLSAPAAAVEAEARTTQVEAATEQAKGAWQPTLAQKAKAARAVIGVGRIAMPTTQAIEKASEDTTEGKVLTAAKLTTITGVVSSMAATSVGKMMGQAGRGLVRGGTMSTNGLAGAAAVLSIPDTISTFRQVATSTHDFASACAEVWKAQRTGSPSAVATARAKVSNTGHELLGNMPRAVLSSSYLVGDVLLAGNVGLTARAAYQNIARAVPTMAKSEVLKTAIQAGLLSSKAGALVRSVAGSEAGKAVAAVAGGPWGKAAGIAFKFAGPIYLAMDAVNVSEAWNADPRDMKRVALRSLALAGTAVSVAAVFAPAAVISASTAAVVGTAAGVVWGAAKLGEYLYDKAKASAPAKTDAAPTSFEAAFA